MTSSGIIIDSRVRRVRELERELAAARAARSAAEAALEASLAHAAETALAMRDAAAMSAAGESSIVIIDGHNLLFRSGGVQTQEKERRERLARKIAEFAAARPRQFVWLVFDGPSPGGCANGNFRISYSGGEGRHRADRLIVDYLRAMKLAGVSAQTLVATSDAQLAKDAEKLGASTVSCAVFAKEAGL